MQGAQWVRFRWGRSVFEGAGFERSAGDARLYMVQGCMGCKVCRCCRNLEGEGTLLGAWGAGGAGV